MQHIIEFHGHRSIEIMLQATNELSSTSKRGKELDYGQRKPDRLSSEFFSDKIKKGE